jgi:hypothetical protein
VRGREGIVIDIAGLLGGRRPVGRDASAVEEIAWRAPEVAAAFTPESAIGVRNDKRDIGSILRL